jgi:prefoldin subunit 5
VIYKITDGDWLARIHDLDREIEHLRSEVAALHGQLRDADGYIADLEQQLRQCRG